MDPWGRWRISARTARHEAVVEAACDAPGTPLRAPTIDEGLTPFCRDSFCGRVRRAAGRGGAGGAAAGAGLACMPARRAASGSGWTAPPRTPAPQVRIRVWPAGQAGGPPLLDCTSAGSSGAVEVGGGPWFSPWRQQAEMAGPVKQLLNLPLDVEALAGWLPPQLRPPGL